MIWLYNTLTKTKEQFTPIKEGTVTMYNCGPTVYGYPHIGNMRSYIFADTLKRVLGYDGLKVHQVINITDVGHLTGDGDEGADKIESSAKKEGKKAQEIADFYTKIFFEELKKLNINIANTDFPKATEHIKEQIALIQSLEEKGFTYKTSDGIYFDTSKFKDYGKLGHQNLEGNIAGARVSINSEKINPSDFALWKFSPAHGKREQEWESPWGTGFPGWHIECSAMSKKYLGDTFDIHTGGVDHITIHHNNEIAQSESANGKTLANFWLHNEYLMIDGEKISKSIGNIITLNDLQTKNISPLAFRLFILGAHYRSHINFTWDAVLANEKAYQKIIKAYQKLGDTVGNINQEYQKEFIEAVNDDLNTSLAIALLWKLIKDKNVNDADKLATIDSFDMVLGLNIKSESQHKEKKPAKIPKKVIDLILAREEARKNKNWILSDEKRKEIEELGYFVKDTENGQEITKKS